MFYRYEMFFQIGRVYIGIEFYLRCYWRCLLCCAHFHRIDGYKSVFGGLGPKKLWTNVSGWRMCPPFFPSFHHLCAFNILLHTSEIENSSHSIGVSTHAHSKYGDSSIDSPCEWLKKKTDKIRNSITNHATPTGPPIAHRKIEFKLCMSHSFDVQFTSINNEWTFWRGKLIELQLFLVVVAILTSYRIHMKPHILNNSISKTALGRRMQFWLKTKNAEYRDLLSLCVICY